MPKKRHSPEEIVGKLRQVDVMTSQGRTLAEAIRSIGVAEATYHRWRNEFGGLKLGQVRRSKELELEIEPLSRQWFERRWRNRLRKAVSDLTLDKLILTEALSGK